MSDGTDARYWVDILDRKPECGRYLFRPRRVEVVVNGRTLRVVMPDALAEGERTRFLATVESENRLSLIASHRVHCDDPNGRGVVLIARRHEDGESVVHVWHELYPWALTYLGLPAPGEIEETRA